MSPKITLPIHRVKEVTRGLGLGKAEESILSPENNENWRRGGAGAVSVYHTPDGEQVTVLGLGRLFNSGQARVKIVYSESLEEKVKSILRQSKER